MEQDIEQIIHDLGNRLPLDLLTHRSFPVQRTQIQSDGDREDEKGPQLGVSKISSSSTTVIPCFWAIHSLLPCRISDRRCGEVAS
jgi:hypothetical protein